VAGATVGGRRPPTAGRRDLPEEFTFKTFCDWIRRERVTPPVEDQSERGWSASITGSGRGLTGVSPLILCFGGEPTEIPSKSG